MKKQNQLSHVLIFSNRMDLREVMREALKGAQMHDCDVQAIAFPEQFIEEMEKNDRSLLVLDWEAGEDKVQEILKKAEATYTLETRPTLLLARNATDKLAGIGYEYHVSRIYTGEVSMDRIQGLFISIANDDALHSPLRSVISRVNEKRSSNQWSEATKILEGVREKVPDNPKVLAELAENKIQEDLWQEALDILKPLINLDPPYVRALHIIGRCCMKLGKFDKAAEAFKKAKLTNPFNVDRLILLGQSLLQNSQVSEARENFNEARGLDPSSKAASEGAGTCMLLEGEINEALALLKEVSNNRERAAVFNSSAILAMRRGDYTHGMTLYDSAMTAIGGDAKLKARLFFNKGIGYCRWHRENEAVTCFERAWKSDQSFEKARKNYLALAKKLGIAVNLGQQESGMIPAKASKPAVASPPADNLDQMDEAIDGSLNLDLTGSSELSVDFDDDLEDESLSFL